LAFSSSTNRFLQREKNFYQLGIRCHRSRVAEILAFVHAAIHTGSITGECVKNG
jgi:hypothetical protein